MRPALALDARASAHVEVAAAVILRGDGRLLLAQRPPGKVYAGYWEFPGRQDRAPANRADERTRGASCMRNWGSRRSRVYPWIDAGLRLSARRGAAAFFPCRELAGRAARPRRRSSLPGSRTRVSPSRRCFPANGPILRALASAPGVRHQPCRESRRGGVRQSVWSARWRKGSSSCRSAKKTCRLRDSEGLADAVNAARRHGARSW